MAGSLPHTTQFSVVAAPVTGRDAARKTNGMPREVAVVARMRGRRPEQ